jgi:hypothetical protein
MPNSPVSWRTISRAVAVLAEKKPFGRFLKRVGELMPRLSRRQFLYDGAIAASWMSLASSSYGQSDHKPLPGGVHVRAALFEMDGVERTRMQLLQPGTVRFGSAALKVDLEGQPVNGRLSLTSRLRVTEGTTPPMMAVWELAFQSWSKEHYVLFPGAVYAGNRFEVRKLDYPPRLSAEDASPSSPVIITDVPRLELREGNSAIALRTSDQSQPAVGIWDPHQKIAWLMFAPPGTEAGQSSWLLEEDEHRASAVLRLCAPGVRPWRYTPKGSRSISQDKPLQLNAGEALTQRLEVEFFPCASVETLFNRLFQRRGALCPEPLSRDQAGALQCAQTIVLEKHLTENWVPEFGLFFSQPRPFGSAPYQAGWIGGMLAALAFLQGPNPLCRQNAALHFETELTAGMAPGGLFFGKATREGRWIPDFSLDTRHPWAKDWTLVRRQADALWAGVVIANILDRTPDVLHSLATCDAALQRVAEAFCSVWKKSQSFGQFLDQHTNQLIVGNSTSAALAPAALCLAGKRYRCPDFIETARQSGEKLYWDWTHKGVTCGGPGDALQCPDSESAFALVESFVALAAATKDQQWMQRAAAAAQQAATWVMPYDFAFPEGSEFHRLDMRTTGTVWANTQNKHAAPGICTLSGEGLATIHSQATKAGFGDILHAIHAALPQFVSTADRTIHDPFGRPLGVGWMNEKVNTCDWVNMVGGVEHESSWCEISLLLSAAVEDQHKV